MVSSLHQTRLLQCSNSPSDYPLVQGLVRLVVQIHHQMTDPHQSLVAYWLHEPKQGGGQIWDSDLNFLNYRQLLYKALSA